MRDVKEIVVEFVRAYEEYEKASEATAKCYDRVERFREELKKAVEKEVKTEER